MKYRIAKMKEKIVIWISWHLPKSVAYWCAIRVGSHATCGQYGTSSPTDLLFMDALDRWEKQL
jgi:hypothetical protein